LLLKGLEAEVAVVLYADVMDARNLYVALTRGSKKLVVCSKSKVLTLWAKAYRPGTAPAAESSQRTMHQPNLTKASLTVEIPQILFHL
jgi:ATP-dependent exoDNAse (exonuclease V) beta subunit